MAGAKALKGEWEILPLLRLGLHSRSSGRRLAAPAVPLEKIGAELWQHDLWWKIICAALANKPDQIDLDYHPALSQPAVSRYAATTPKQLRWFDRYNEKRPHEQQVKPTGFLYALHADPLAEDTDEVFDAVMFGKRVARKPLKPVSPYDSDLKKAVSQCFDRETGLPIAANRLLSYKEAIAYYHLHPESKFLNGDYLDRGVTRRRYVYPTGVRNIGKEANEWEPLRHFALLNRCLPSNFRTLQGWQYVNKLHIFAVRHKE